jgi:thymidine kinase
MDTPGLDLVFGTMFSGKTTYLFNYLNKARVLNRKALYITHTLDNRNTITHNAALDPSVDIPKWKVESLDAIDHEHLSDIDIIGIDEGQFFKSLTAVKRWVDDWRKRVVIVGLAGDFKRQIFGEMTSLIPHADTIVKLDAFCQKCAENKRHTPAVFNHRTVKNTTTVLAGGAESYEVLCRECFLAADRRDCRE